MSRPKVLLLTHDRIGPRMAGPAIRTFELGRGLAGLADVTVLSALPVAEIDAPEIAIRSFAGNERLLRELVASADVLVLQGLLTRRYPFLLHARAHRVLDLYDPYQFEALNQGERDDPDRAHGLSRLRGILDEQMRHADLMLVANERQRDMWLGRACALGLMEPEELDRDPTWARRMAIVPFGLHLPATAAPRAGLRQQVSPVGQEDPVLLWGGGIWDWFDPLSLIRSMPRLIERHPRVRLVFMGTRHPSPDVPMPRMLAHARALADELRLSGEHVIFHDGWVPYEERLGWYGQADIGLTAHLKGLETRYAFRTRVLDYLAAGLPLATTEGDCFADLVRGEELGVVVPYADATGWTEGLDRLLQERDRPEGHARRTRIARVAARYRWSEVVRPLQEWIVRGRQAAPVHARGEPLAPRSFRQMRRLKQWLEHGWGRRA